MPRQPPGRARKSILSDFIRVLGLAQAPKKAVRGELSRRRSWMPISGMPRAGPWESRAKSDPKLARYWPRNGHELTPNWPQENGPKHDPGLAPSLYLNS